MKNFIIGGIVASVVLLGSPFMVVADEIEKVAVATPTDGGANNTPTDGGANNTPTDGGQNNSQNAPSSGSVKLLNPLNADNPDYNILDFLRSIIEIILVFAIPIIVIFIMYSGFLFVTARGEPAQIQKARAAFTWAIVGGVIVLGAWAILEAVKGTVDAIIT